ncbi:hypothetical protein ma392 [Moumouvirus australiensis]|uniref:Uncharacterized protein n=1 Tax=Moumouvirus australiensis TaxID=2109587 RepID=A0A2P1ELP8_9VIRU|nr:hypothetical protein QKC55_gp513 [Moumouvirus australiensis]AVL94778.1 hypothetical protein ma392 [Moumouvirus australiensis]
MTKIDGPINVVRMSGYVNNIKKVIYLFMEKHNKLENQTDCQDDSSIDIINYLTQNFQNLNSGNTKVDFFLETNPGHLSAKISETIFSSGPSLEYLESLWYFFYKNIKIDKNKISSNFKNVRFHYIDIRQPLYILTTRMIDVAQEIFNNKDKELIIADVIITCLKIIVEFFGNFIDFVKSDTKNIKTKVYPIKNKNAPYIVDVILKRDCRQQFYDEIFYFLNKIKYDYNHNSVKNIVNTYLHNDILEEAIKVKNDVKKLYDYVAVLTNEDYENNYLSEKIKNELDHLDYELFTFDAKIVDLYFLRRFLDKDYITNAVVYTGAYHSMVYIYMLRTIGFKITHCAKTNIYNINELNDIVLENKLDFGKFLDTFTLDNTLQCSDLEGFPENFR